MFRRSILPLAFFFTTASIAPVLGQGARLPESQACFDQRLDQPADLQDRVAACSRVIGDSSQGAEKRAEAYLRRGFAYAQRADQSKTGDDVDRALADLSEASRLAPSNPRVHRYVLETRAGLFLRSAAYDRAVGDYTALIALEPNSAAAYAYRGIANKALGKTSEAASDLRKALSLDPSNARLQEELRLAGEPGARQTVPSAPPAIAHGAWSKGADASQIELLKGEVRKAQEAAKAAEERLAAMEANVSAPAVQPAEANPAAADLAKLARSLQTELKRVGCDPGPIDAQWGQKTQQALQKFAEQTKLALPVEEPTTAALNAVSAQQGPVCRLACADHQVEVSGSCIARPQARAQRHARPSRRVRSPEQASPDPAPAGPPIGITIGIGRRGGIGIGF